MKKKVVNKKSPLRLKEVFQRVDWEDVACELVGLYPELRPKLAEYEQVFEQLKEMEPLLSDGRLEVSFEEPDPELWDVIYTVYGCPGADAGGEALVFAPWAEWLGREVVEEPFDGMPKCRIVAVCLYEMTSHGFTEEAIREEKLLFEKEFREYLKRRESETETGWEDCFDPSPKEALRSLRKWFRWGGIARDYFGQSGSWFVAHFIADEAPDFYEEVDRRTIKAALREIARKLLQTEREM